MKLRKRLLKKSLLYVILDKEICGLQFRLISESLAKNLGLGIIQLRDKLSSKKSILREALLLQRLFFNTKTLFIVNDYLEIAKIVDCDGVHLGQDDTPIEIARKVLGRDKIIGISCHNLKQALRAQKYGADYIGIGPVFTTPAKPEYKAIGLNLIKKLNDKIKIPFFLIGGINLNNTNRVLSAGAKRIAVCRAICQ